MVRRQFAKLGVIGKRCSGSSPDLGAILYASVAELAQAAHSKCAFCGFKSHPKYQSILYTLYALVAEWQMRLTQDQRHLRVRLPPCAPFKTVSAIDLFLQVINMQLVQIQSFLIRRVAHLVEQLTKENKSCLVFALIV